MGREEVHQEMKDFLGGAVSLLDRVPDEFLDSEWDLLKRAQLSETLIPQQYKELIGLAVAAALGSRHWTLFHTEAAGLAGATDSEIEEAVRYARMVSGWITYINGLQIDYEAFAEEVAEATAYLRRNRADTGAI